jgi:hypothetical protein
MKKKVKSGKKKKPMTREEVIQLLHECGFDMGDEKPKNDCHSGSFASPSDFIPIGFDDPY